jgi:hypothetical protein
MINAIRADSTDNSKPLIADERVRPKWLRGVGLYTTYTEKQAMCRDRRFRKLLGGFLARRRDSVRCPLRRRRRCPDIPEIAALLRSRRAQVHSRPTRFVGVDLSACWCHSGNPRRGCVFLNWPVGSHLSLEALGSAGTLDSGSGAAPYRPANSSNSPRKRGETPCSAIDHRRHERPRPEAFQQTFR